MYPRPFPYEESAKYPFSETSTFRINETLRFPVDFITDAHLYAERGETYEITRIIKKENDLLFVIGPPFHPALITGQYSLTDREDHIDLFDTYGRRAGVMVVKSAEAFLFFPDGDYRLQRGSARFEVSCHLFVEGDFVSGFAVNGKLVSGEVEFIGTQGVILERDGNTVIIHFTGEPYYALWRRADYGEEYFNRYISRILLSVHNTLHPEHNHSLIISPDANGNIPIYTNSLLLYGDALRLKGGYARLDISLAKK